MEDFNNSLDELTRRGLKPARVTAAFLCGSLARGWGNARSDADIYLVTPEQWHSETANDIKIQTVPDTVPLETAYVENREWEVKYWIEDQVEQILSKVGWDQFDDKTELRLTKPEHGLLARLPSCVPIAGEQWISCLQKRLSESAFQAMMVRDCLAETDLMIEDTIGQLEAQDYESAVLSVRDAQCCVVDSLLAAHGQLDRTSKWRARRMRDVKPPELSFEEYWAWETMRGFNPSAPATWVLASLQLCNSVKEAVESVSLDLQSHRIRLDARSEYPAPTER